MIEVFLKNHLNLNADIEGFTRIDQYEIPLKALREAVLNAFLHRSYSRRGANIKIAIFDDIVEITSPGVLPASINLYNIFNSRRSEVRNKTLARIFKELGYIEQWGTGMKKIYDYCKAVNLKSPEISEKGNFLQVVFFRNTDKTPINTDKTQEHEEKIVDYLKNNTHITNKKARELTGLSADGIKSLFRRMVEKNILEKHGEKRGTYYRLGKSPIQSDGSFHE
jgi:ATP-dependent DNA helicase RecG